MECVNSPTFYSEREELDYWKTLAKRLNEEKNSLKKEFDDYTADSQQLEQEYETTIDQHERTLKELRTINNKSQNEIENLRLKLDQGNRESASFQNRIDALEEEKARATKYIRELEQKNDDLERSQRCITETVAAFEASLNSALERNAMLESEVDEKEHLKDNLQRLVDETRDLKQELHVREIKVPDNERIMNGHGGAFDSNRLRSEHETQTSPLKRDPKLAGLDGSPASRILALNLVGDVLRRVGNLETNLGRYRNSSRDVGYTPDSMSRNRHLNRGGAGSPSVQSYMK